MKANELRLGNWVNYDEKPFMRFPENGDIELNSTHLYYLFDVDDDWDMIKPIPLTEEWLLKCGFYLVDKNFFIHDLLSIGIRKSNGFYMNNVTNEIKYLHQLQNLYFALTGEELELKNEPKP